MSDKCKWCGLSQEHESHLCVLKDDSTYRMELNVPVLTGTALAWIGAQVEAAQKAHPGKWIEVRIKGIAPLPRESKFHCDECEDEREHYHNHTAMGTLLMFGDKIEDCPKLNPPSAEYGGGVTLDFVERLSSSLGHKTSDGRLCDLAIPPPEPLHALIMQANMSTETWVCTNHPPGSEIEVKKGEKCFCGRTE